MADAAKQRLAMLNAVQRAKAKLTESREETVRTVSSTSTPAGGAVALTEFPEYMAAPAPRGQMVRQSAAKDDRAHFVTTWAGKVEAFVNDSTKTTFELPADLTGFDRKTLHQLATKYNLSHHSVGQGRERHLVLKKDELFYRADMRPTDASLDGLKERPLTHRERQAKREEEAAQESEKAQYADKAAFKAFRKFAKATNPNARAVESAANLDGLAQGGVASEQPAEPAPSFDAPASHWDGVLHAAAAGPSDTAQVQQQKLFEACSVCGTKSELDYDVSRWECTGPCEQCGKQTIWVLQTEAGDTVEHASKPKRGRDDAELPEPAAQGAPRAEGDDTAAPQATEKLTADELVELAKMHEMSDADVKWIGSFAASREKQGCAEDRVLFCPDFVDLAPLLPSKASLAAKGQRLFVAKLVEDDGTPVTKKINKLLLSIEKRATGDDSAATTKKATAIKDVFACFPAMVMYGAALEVVVAVVVDESRVHEAEVRLAAQDVPGAATVVGETVDDVVQ